MKNINRPPKSVPKSLLPFLSANGSLTQKLSQKAGKPLTVQVQFEGFRLLTLDEWQAYRQLNAHFLSNDCRHLPKKSHLAWVREVSLCVDGQAWVRAKSFVLIDELKGKMHRLRHLGNTPMGHILFNRHKKLPFVRQFMVKNQQFARQSLYDWQGQRVFVEEWLFV